MSTAAPAVSRPRVASKGWVKVPSSLIENQAAFTRAEFSLALVVLRRAGGLENTPVTVSDVSWKNWTGLSPRLKEYAIAGLKEKCMGVTGRGEQTRFAWQGGKWNNFIRHSGYVKAHTVGRKIGVAAKPGATVHPECKARGCAMLQTGTGCGELIMFPTPDAQPVAQGCAGETETGPREDQPSAGPVAVLDPPTQNDLSSSASIPVAQPVAQTEATPWPLTLATIREHFPLAGAEFVAKLASHVTAQNFRGTIDDRELASAVQVAYAYKRQYQKSEGLFLATVPAALKLLRKKPLVRARDEAGAMEDIAEILASPEAQEILRLDAEAQRQERECRKT